MADVSFLIGNLNKEHGGAQKLLYDVTKEIPTDDHTLTVYYLFGDGTFANDFEANGVRVIPLDAQSNRDWSAFLRLVHHLRQNQPDILQTNSPISGVWGRMASTFTPVENVVSVEHTVRSGLSTHARLMNALTLPIADVMVAVSTPVAESYPISERCLTQRVEKRTIYNGVNIQDVQNSCDTGDMDCGGGPIVGTVGRLADPKGLDRLLDAAPAVIDECPSVTFQIVGDGPKRDSLQRQAREQGIAERVEFTGFTANPYPAMAGFTIGVYPSRWEGMPIAPLETIAAGTPVVSSDIEIFQEILGDRGIIVNPVAREELSGALIKLIQDRDRNEQYKTYLQDRVEDNFSISSTAREYEALYRELAE